LLNYCKISTGRTIEIKSKKSKNVHSIGKEEEEIISGEQSTPLAYIR